MKQTNMLVPSLVLVIICLVVTGILAYTHGITEPYIKANETAVEEEAEKKVLGEAGGKAYSVTVTSYGGDFTAMVGINDDGEVVGIEIISHNDTPGLGTQACEPDYLKQFMGLTELTSGSVRDDGQIDAITGATISSDAVYNAVKQALEKFHEEGGGTI